MKVLLVHNYYRSSSPSGEDAVYEHEAELLRNRGVEVVRYIRRNDEITNPLQAIFDAVWSKRTYREVLALIKKEKPDVAHFHNIWYLISPSAYHACKDSGVPVVQTLHNFRMFCANGLLLRNGKTCEDCIGKTPWRGVAYGCYRSSRLYSLPVAFTEMVHRRRGTWVNAVDAYIALTEFGKKKFIECGLPEGKINLKPNFASDVPSQVWPVKNYAGFVGRISHEKGVETLVNAVRHLGAIDFKFKIVGDGPLRNEINGISADRLEIMGKKDHDECMKILSGAAFAIMPAICYENFPLSIVEAFAYGKPVIASNLGAMASIIKDRETGLLFQPGNAEELASKMKWMIENPDECVRMGKNARMEFEAKFTAGKNYEILMEIYQETIDRCRR